MSNIDSLIDEVTSRLIDAREHPDAKTLFAAYLVIKKRKVGNGQLLLLDFAKVCKAVLPTIEFELEQIPKE